MEAEMIRRALIGVGVFAQRERRRPVLAAWSNFLSGPADNVVAIKRRVRAPYKKA